MEKNYNFNFVNRTRYQSSGITSETINVTECKKSALSDSLKTISNGKVYHTTDTNEFFYDWNGKRYKLDLFGSAGAIEAAEAAAAKASAAASKADKVAKEASAAASQASALLSGVKTIKSVTSITNGYKLTLSDGSTLELKNGEKGAKGATGATGAQGPVGPAGADGAKGADGADGADGKSAYELAVEAGFNGTLDAWLDFLKGADGQDGVTPTIAIDPDTKHWIINGVDSGVVAEGKDGESGAGGSADANSIMIKDIPEAPEEGVALQSVIVDLLIPWISDIEQNGGSGSGDGVSKDYVDGEISRVESSIPTVPEIVDTLGDESVDKIVSARAISVDLINYIDGSISDTLAYVEQQDASEHAGRVAGDELLQTAIDGKLDILPLVDDPDDPGNGWPYHIPYNVIPTVTEDGITLTIKTITLDNNATKWDNTMELPAASPLNAGLMTASDKVALNGKQDELVSGTNIKTINGVSILGEGDIVISGDGSDNASLVNTYSISEYFGTTNLWQDGLTTTGSELVDTVLDDINDENMVIIEAGDFKFVVTGSMNGDGYRGFSCQYSMINSLNLAKAKVYTERIVILYVDTTDTTYVLYNSDLNSGSGETGADGKSAYQLAVEAGFEGNLNEWLESLKGADGEDGASATAETLMIKISPEESWSVQQIFDEVIVPIEDMVDRGNFPTGEGAEDETDAPEGQADKVATIQSVMDYVNLMFEKKKSDEPVGEVKDYIYISGVRYAEGVTPTPIYLMNCFEIDDDMLANGIEIKAGNEILGYDGGADDPATVYTHIFSVDVPEGYSIVVHAWDALGGNYFNAEYPMFVNPRYSTKKYGNVTYNCYVRYNTSEFDDAQSAELRYKILISKD